MTSPTIAIENVSKTSIVCSAGVLANTFCTRLIGLLGRRELPAESGMLITPSSGVHTFGMRFPIDIVALDQEQRILGIWPGTSPWKIRGMNRRTRSVLELRSGHAGKCGLSVGDQLRVRCAVDTRK